MLSALFFEIDESEQQLALIHEVVHLSSEHLHDLAWNIVKDLADESVLETLKRELHNANEEIACDIAAAWARQVL